VTPASEREVVGADASVRSAGDLFAAMRSIPLLARLYILQGRLGKAAATYAQVVEVVPQPEVLQTPFTRSTLDRAGV
jgi:hypothetical protein